jgi:hypothetical protein
MPQVPSGAGVFITAELVDGAPGLACCPQANGQAAARQSKCYARHFHTCFCLFLNSFMLVFVHVSAVLLPLLYKLRKAITYLVH